MKILAISRGAWNSNNNTGNTLENFFGNSPFEMYNLYMRAELPQKNPCKSIFRITEQQLLNSIIHRQECGAVLNSDSFTKETDVAIVKEKNIYDKVKHSNSYLLWLIREFLWSNGKWKSENLKEYIENIKPDIIFMPVFGCWYPHKVLLYIQKMSNAKIVLFHADDNYSLKQFSLSPVYWIYRLILRKWIRKSVRIASLNYCISMLQKKEYEKSLKTQFRFLQKFADFSVKPSFNTNSTAPLKMIYTGNLSAGRWKSLALIAKALKAINANGKKANMFIYSTTHLTDKQKRMLDDNESIFFKGSVASREVEKIQMDSDILIHVESFNYSNRLKVRQSFSTKIVDYFRSRKCLLVVGPEDVASIDSFLRNNTAYTITKKDSIKEKLELLLSDRKMIANYADKAWQYGATNNGEEKKRLFYKELSNLKNG